MSSKKFESPSKIARPDFAGLPPIDLATNDLQWAINQRQKSLTDNFGSYKKRSMTFQLK